MPSETYPRLGVEREDLPQPGTPCFVDISKLGIDLVRLSAEITGAAGEPWHAGWVPTPFEPPDLQDPRAEDPENLRAPLLRIGTLDGFGELRPPAFLHGVGIKHLALPDTAESYAVARSKVLRAMATSVPGSVELHVVEHVGDALKTGAFSDFSAFGDELYHNVYPSGLGDLIGKLSEHQHKLITEPAVKRDIQNDPWHIVVVVGGGSMRTDVHEKLEELARGNPKWGSLITIGVPLAQSNQLVQRGPDANWPYTPDVSPSSELVQTAGGFIQNAAAENRKSPPMENFFRGEPGKGNPDQGLVAIVGLAGGEEAVVSFDMRQPHMLIEGGTGQGKTNFVLQVLLQLAYRYSPKNLHILALDFKGPGLAPLASSAEGLAWLPHLKLIGSRIEDDHEAGIALLEHLANEIEARAAAKVAAGVREFSRLREKQPDEWPYLMVVLDELQILLEGEHGERAAELLEHVLRIGREFGIYLIISSQTLKGPKSLIARGDPVMGQLAWRVGAPKAEHVMDLISNREATLHLRRNHMVVNNQYGYVDGNQTVHIPWITEDGLNKMKQFLWEGRPENNCPPFAIDRAVAPELAKAQAFAETRPAAGQVGRAIIGQGFGVAPNSVTFDFDPSTGRNFAVFGVRYRTPEVPRLMDTIVSSTAKCHLPGDAHFSIVSLNPAHDAAARQLAEKLQGEGYNHSVTTVGASLADYFFAETATGVRPDTINADGKHYIVIYGGDNLDESGKHVDAILAKGSRSGTHIIGNWSDPDQLKASLGGYNPNTKAFGGYAALDVNGSLLGQMTPGAPFGINWGSHRPGRVLFYDARGDGTPKGRRPQVVVLYE